MDFSGRTQKQVPARPHLSHGQKTSTLTHKQKGTRSHHHHLDPVHVDARKNAGGSQSLPHGGVGHGRHRWLNNTNHSLSLSQSFMHAWQAVGR